MDRESEPFLRIVRDRHGAKGRQWIAEDRRLTLEEHLEYERYLLGDILS